MNLTNLITLTFTLQEYLYFSIQKKAKEIACSVVNVHQCMQLLCGTNSTERSADMVRAAGQHRQRSACGTAENTHSASPSQCEGFHITISNTTHNQMPTMTKRDIYLVLCLPRNTDRAKDLQYLGFLMNVTRDKSINTLSCSFLNHSAQ